MKLLLAALDGPDSAESIDADLIRNYIVDTVLPYLSSTQRQLGKRATSTEDASVQTQAITHMEWLSDIGSTLCWMVSKQSSAEPLASLSAPCAGEEDDAFSAAGQLVLALQQTYDDLVPMLIEMLAGKVPNRFIQVCRLHLLGLFRCLLDRCYESPIVASSTIDNRQLIDEYSQLWMTLIERMTGIIMPQHADSSVPHLTINAPLLIDFAQLYGWKSVEQVAKHAVQLSNMIDTTSLEFATVSLQHWSEQECIALDIEGKDSEGASVINRSWSDGTLVAEATNGDEFNYRTVAIAPSADALQMDSLIAGVRDIFPDYGDGYVEACLLHFDRDMERTIAALCDPESLPPSLTALDPHLKRRITETASSASYNNNERATPLNQAVTAPQTNAVDLATRRVLDDRREWGDVMAFKASTLRSDETEYDYYYEQNDDVEESMDEDLMDPWMRSLAMPDEERQSGGSSSGTSAVVGGGGKIHLIQAYLTDPSVFERKHRQTKDRRSLKLQTGFSDEQIEGWRVILERNPRKQEILSQFSMDQVLSHRLNNALNLGSSKGESDELSATTRNNTDAPGTNKGHPSGRGRGRGRGANRKSGHSRKMAKGFGRVID